MTKKPRRTGSVLINNDRVLHIFVPRSTSKNSLRRQLNRLIFSEKHTRRPIFLAFMEEPKSEENGRSYHQIVLNRGFTQLTERYFVKEANIDTQPLNTKTASN